MEPNQQQHLLTLSAKIDQISSLHYETDDERFLAFHMAIYRHNELLKQKLHPRLFVPCVDGKPISHPNKRVTLDWIDEETLKQEEAYKQNYHKAQQAVIFEGWEVVDSCNDGLGFIVRRNQQSLYFYETINGCICKISHALFPASRIITLADLAAATIGNPLKLKP